MHIDFAITIPGYTIMEQISKTHYSTVYRAAKTGEAQTVIIKALSIREPTPAQIARFRHEYELVRGVNIDGIIKTIGFIDYEGTLALVLEDFGGISLKKIIPDGFTMERFLNLAVRLAEILGILHQNNIIHRDIKPNNILLNVEADTLKIADFGIATETLQIDNEISNPITMEGTLPYIAPEQTGRMNCAVDYRADLYSLGITFYEMLTGQLPFQSKDPVEIIHAHIAKIPAPPHQLNSEVPGLVSDIVMKLLSKSTEERYQNGFGLAADLREGLRQLQKTGRIKPFPLGSRDISPRFIIPQTMIGREDEYYVLYAAFERVSQGRVEVMLVTGEPGIGKSTLVNEISKPIVGKRGYFITGKFDPFQKTVPYSAIVQAFQGLVRQLLTQSDEYLRNLKERLLADLGPNGKIITDAIPEIELIIGKQPDVQDLGSEETRNRFNLSFKKFVRAFADEKQPLVMFLDDLQWVDPASLHLMQTIATDQELRYALFIGAF
ncbi:MAG TPA: AAA family ATPase, partial [Candidatus Hydrogenedentes bacterium]|nr:AAA family ATPase [Candidatus Hydrogenedentota bacterium]